MKYPVQLLVAAFALLAGVSHARGVTGIERAIRELPPKFVADIPLANRDALLQSLRRDSTGRRLDLKHGFLHFYSDSSHDGVHATSMLYMRQFQRADGGFVILTHMPKPFADSSTPRANQTFVFERHKGRWIDITADVFPRGVDLKSHFRPRRTSAIVDIAPYERTLSYLGKPRLEFGSPALELHWNGSVFQKRKATTRTFSGK